MNKKTWWLVVLGVWALAEVGYRTYVNHASHFGGRPYWPYYAYYRNRAAIGRLYALTAPGRNQYASLEAREGRLADSAGHLPPAARALVQQLARDIAPAGYFYFAVNPVQQGDSLMVTVSVPCPVSCGCFEWLRPAAGGSVLFTLSGSGPERRHTPTELEYVRTDNASVQAAWRQYPCYAPLGPGEFLNAQALRANGPLPYSEYQSDLLLFKPLRAIGLL
ncbi:hypothetical protein [Hymenobacter canadensis]|uniref:DUF4384 domain-containing protein n=1 Tax=Hymenobacter canadensis TaxID=2999067 RepID=A0ABY7LXW6_9BACT|nr:hypothetical protein [Hymenobacter canadensis]WBA44356.1 hypothetical protein O3303_21355 [Hymenobacter canadensis]